MSSKKSQRPVIAALACLLAIVSSAAIGCAAVKVIFGDVEAAARFAKANIEVVAVGGAALYVILFALSAHTLFRLITLVRGS